MGIIQTSRETTREPKNTTNQQSIDDAMLGTLLQTFAMWVSNAENQEAIDDSVDVMKQFLKLVPSRDLSVEARFARRAIESPAR